MQYAKMEYSIVIIIWQYTALAASKKTAFWFININILMIIPYVGDVKARC